MLSRFRSRLTYANVMSTLAVFLALAGGGTAVALSGSNTVFSDDIANDNFNSPTEGQGGLVASDLRAGSVTTSEVANGTLKAEDYGIGSVSGARIQDNNVTTLDLADGAIFGNDIRDFSLNDEDVGQGTFVNFEATIGTVPAQRCANAFLSGVTSSVDHLLLTPNFVDANGNLEYSALYTASSPEGPIVAIHICNPTTSDINDGTTHFSLLVIDAQ
jgi:hypothetical protein